MLIDNLIFWAFAVLSVGAALGVVFHRSVIYAALFLVVVFFSIAGVFLLNNADFLAVAQTIVYGVGLTIVILFGIMFTGDRLFQDSPVTRRQFLAFMIIAALTLVLFIPAALNYYPAIPTPTELITVLKTEGTTRLLGRSLFSTYALPFELASILLLLAMVGAIVISKKTFVDEPETLKYDLTETDLSAAGAAEFKKKYTDIIDQGSAKAELSHAHDAANGSENRPESSDVNEETLVGV